MEIPAPQVSEEPSTTGEPPSVRISVRRLDNNPIIRPGMDDRMGANIQGPHLNIVWYVGDQGMSQGFSLR